MPSRGIIRRKSDRSQKIVMIEMIDKLFSAWFIIQNVACLLNSHKSLGWNMRFHLVSTLTRTFACHTWHRETVEEAIQRNGTTSSRLHHAECNRRRNERRGRTDHWMCRGYKFKYGSLFVQLRALPSSVKFSLFSRKFFEYAECLVRIALNFTGIFCGGFEDGFSSARFD